MDKRLLLRIHKGGFNMNKYEKGLTFVEERCGNGKDNVISLSTIAIDANEAGYPRPYIRDVDAYYEDGVFYITTWAKSIKMMQITQNKEVAFSVCLQSFSGNGIGENLGWVLDPKNAALRVKLRKVFHQWYDEANDESDENCVILAIRITNATLVDGHGANAVRYFMDFVNQVATEVTTMK